MPLYSAIQPLVEANQWFRNGDHPDDRTINRINTGRVVKRSSYYQSDNANYQCEVCGERGDQHGLLGNQLVCPGDYILTVYNTVGKKVGYNWISKTDFESKYELYKGSVPQ